MTYIDLINSFWDMATTNPLSTGQVSLYFALLHVCNRSYWTEWFQAPNQVLSVLTGLSRSGILKARNELKQRGLIDFRERGTKATSYRIVVAGSVQTDSYMSESKQESVQDGVQNGKQNSAHDGVQDSTQESKHAIDSIYNNLNTKRQKTKDISPAEHFEEFLSAYPKECSRYLTETAYYDLLLAGKVSEKELVQCAVNYADWCRILGKNEQFIKNGENFLKEFVFEKYLPGNYKKPKPPAKNSFTSFPQNDYDFDQLEKEILSN